MEGLPVVNEALSVEAVGFTAWDGHLLGVLIAPWFMNLILLPDKSDDWHRLEAGSKQAWALPSGEYEFTVGRVDGVGIYQSCALFSSVRDFPDQGTARQVAQAVMAEIFKRETEGSRPLQGLTQDEVTEPVSRRELFRRTLLRGRGRGE